MKKGANKFDGDDRTKGLCISMSPKTHAALKLAAKNNGRSMLMEGLMRIEHTLFPERNLGAILNLEPPSHY